MTCRRNEFISPAGERNSKKKELVITQQLKTLDEALDKKKKFSWHELKPKTNGLVFVVVVVFFFTVLLYCNCLLSSVATDVMEMDWNLKKKNGFFSPLNSLGVYLQEHIVHEYRS